MNGKHQPVAYAENVIFFLVYVTYINMLQNKSNIPDPSHRTQMNTALSLAREISQETTNLSVQYFFVDVFEITVQNNAFYFRHCLSVCRHVTTRLPLNGILQKNHTVIFHINLYAHLDADKDR